MRPPSPSAVEGDEAFTATLAGWTPEQQIAHMLELCEAQMESALSESDVAVDSLIKAFSSLTETARAFNAAVQSLPPECRTAGAGEAEKQATLMSQQMASAIVAFQFYDKLTQRLGHVRYSLSTLALFVCNRAQTQRRDRWKQLFGTLKRLYRTEEERQIFQMMVEGASAQDARDHIHQTTMTIRAGNTGDVELF
jgi:hypothetical protein